MIFWANCNPAIFDHQKGIPKRYNVKPGSRELPPQKKRTHQKVTPVLLEIVPMGQHRSNCWQNSFVPSVRCRCRTHALPSEGDQIFRGNELPNPDGLEMFGTCWKKTKEIYSYVMLCGYVVMRLLKFYIPLQF